MVYFTRAPLTPDNPLSYASSQTIVEPTSSGSSLTVVAPFEQIPGFNWGQVNGIFIGITSPSTGQTAKYILDSLAFRDLSAQPKDPCSFPEVCDAPDPVETGIAAVGASRAEVRGEAATAGCALAATLMRLGVSL